MVNGINTGKQEQTSLELAKVCKMSKMKIKKALNVICMLACTQSKGNSEGIVNL